MTIGGSETSNRTASESKPRNSAAASPPPTSASAVRFQARYVRSLASVKRGSGSSPSIGASAYGAAMLCVPVVAARRLAVRHQRLSGPRPGKGELLETCRALRCLQLDPTAVVARSHLLVLFSRHGAFDEARLDRLAYEERALFEYWAHEASLVLTEDLPLHRWEMRTWPRGAGGAWARRLTAWYESEAAFRAHILERLRADGPLRARDIEDRSAQPWISHGWTNERNVARLLDLMWVRGQVGISRREGGQRVWDLMERCLPAGAPAGELPEPEMTRRAAALAVRALGVARPAHIRAHFTRGRYPGLADALAALHKSGELERVGVEGLGDDWWVHAEDAGALRDPGAFKPRTVLLSPFDNLICDRARTEKLFGFSHRLEIYTPKAKRRWGYFVLPVLDGDRLVARCDLALDRKTGRLVAHAVYAEPRVPRGKRLPRAIRRELERLAAWRGASEIEVRAAPDAWRAVLAA